MRLGNESLDLFAFLLGIKTFNKSLFQKNYFRPN